LSTRAIRSATVLVAMDKFRGTASAQELGATLGKVVIRRGLHADVQPMSDGGEGFVEAFVGEVSSVIVSGPLGEVVPASVKFVETPHGLLGVLEVATAIGRDLLPAPTSEQALAANSRGVGQLILRTAELGAQRVLVGCGGSATSDGGLGCYEVLRDAGGLPVPVTAATDVTATFFGARRFARQKGVAADDLHLVDERLAHVRWLYGREQGVDVELLERAGAAGGIAGAIAALGGELTSGFDAVAKSVDLSQRTRRAELVVTGEGRFDRGSLEGKVTVGVSELVAETSRLLVVCGSVEHEAALAFMDRFPGATIVSLEERFGLEDAMANVTNCVGAVVDSEIARRTLHS
jgi:glycerate kinase